MARKNILPQSFGDWLSILSFMGFIFIMLQFNPFGESIDLSDFTLSLFMILSGGGLITMGRLFSARKWARDGIQGQEFVWLFTSIFGIGNIVIGILALPSVNLITEGLNGLIALSAISSALFIMYQYFKGGCPR